MDLVSIKIGTINPEISFKGNTTSFVSKNNWNNGVN